MELEHRLSRTVLTRRRHELACVVPELRHRIRVPDQHSGPRLRRIPGKDAAAATRRHDVDTHVAEGIQLAVLRGSDETPEPASSDVLQEHPLHRVVRAEPQDLVALGVDELAGQARTI